MPILTYKDLLSSYNLDLSSKERESKSFEIKQALIREYNEAFKKSLEDKWNSIRAQEYCYIYFIFTPISILLISGFFIFLSGLIFYITGLMAAVSVVNAIQSPFFSSPFFNMLFLGLELLHILAPFAITGCASLISAFMNLYELYDFMNRVSSGQSLRPDYLNAYYKISKLINYTLASILELVSQVIAYCAYYVISNLYNLYQNTLCEDEYVNELLNSYIFLKNDKENCNSEVSNKISKKLKTKFQYFQDTDDLLSYLENAPEMLLSNSNKSILIEIIGLVKHYKGYRYCLVLKGLDKKAKENQSQKLNYFPADALSHAMEFLNDVGGDQSRKFLKIK